MRSMLSDVFVRAKAKFLDESYRLLVRSACYYFCFFAAIKLAALTWAFVRYKYFISAVKRVACNAF